MRLQRSFSTMRHVSGLVRTGSGRHSGLRAVVLLRAVGGHRAGPQSFALGIFEKPRKDRYLVGLRTKSSGAGMSRSDRVLVVNHPWGTRTPLRGLFSPTKMGVAWLERPLVGADRKSAVLSKLIWYSWSASMNR